MSDKLSAYWLLSFSTVSVTRTVNKHSAFGNAIH